MEWKGDGVVVANWDLPNGEGEIEVMVDRAQESAWASILLNGQFFMFHKPCCGGPVRPCKITKSRMVLSCCGCGLRLVLTVKKPPTTLGELREALDETCQHADLPARA